ncbi:MAG: sigma-E factor negative regulatory protein [Gammaproteobacteria bacterium]|nr:sigma-E factor negative regulatory protein [Gammaproteobacteria bacterium]
MMNDRLKESVSALMDGEVDELELARLLKEAESDPEVISLWSRYHLAGALMRRESLMPASERLTLRLREALASEPSLAGAPGANRWVKPLASVAVAAAVALAVVLGFQMMSVPGNEARPDVVVGPVPSISNGTINAAVSDRRRLDAYMLHHAQHRALNDRSSVIPIAKFASFDVQ